MYTQVMYAKNTVKIHQPPNLMYQKQSRNLEIMKMDSANKSAVPRIFPVVTSGNNNTRPSPMSNGIDASTRRIAAWEQKRLQMEACINYEDLMSVVRNTNLEHHFKILDGIRHAKGNFHIDCAAQHFYPQDAPEHLIPC